MFTISGNEHVNKLPYCFSNENPINNESYVLDFINKHQGSNSYAEVIVPIESITMTHNIMHQGSHAVLELINTCISHNYVLYKEDLKKVTQCYPDLKAVSSSIYALKRNESVILAKILAYMNCKEVLQDKYIFAEYKYIRDDGVFVNIPMPFDIGSNPHNVKVLFAATCGHSLDDKGYLYAFPQCLLGNDADILGEINKLKLVTSDNLHEEL